METGSRDCVEDTFSDDERRVSLDAVNPEQEVAAFSGIQDLGEDAWSEGSRYEVDVEATLCERHNDPARIAAFYAILQVEGFGLFAADATPPDVILCVAVHATVCSLAAKIQRLAFHR